jgi:hypothetical protein
MRRWLQAAIVLILLGVTALGLFGAATQASPSARGLQAGSAQLTLTADGVVRAWPSHDTDVVGQMPSRSTVETNGRTPDSQWWRIPYPGGPQGNGWLPANVVQPNQAASSVPVIEVIFATATPAPATPTPAPPACVHNAAYVTDVTIPDHTPVQAAQQFDKVWRMSNSGSCSWEQGTELVFVSGFKMSAPDSVAVPSTAPGATADIGVTMYAPSTPGTYTGVWELRDPAGEFFGSKVTVVINVPDPNPPSPPTPQPPAPPQPSDPYINFWSDTGKVCQGQCTNIHWDVRNVRAVYVEYGGHTDGVAGQGSRWVCPSSDGKTYRLHVDMVDGSTQTRELKIDIDHGCGPTPGPTPTPKPSNRYANVSVNPSEINRGDCTTVSWDIGDMHKLKFDCTTGSASGHQGSCQWCPTKSKETFTVCYNSSCGDRKDVEVKVKFK